MITGQHIYRDSKTIKQLCDDKLTELQNCEFKIIALANKIKKKDSISDNQLLKVLLSKQSLLTREYTDFTYDHRAILRGYKRN